MIEENLGLWNEINFIWSLHLRSPSDEVVGVFEQYVNQSWKTAKIKKTMNPKIL